MLDVSHTPLFFFEIVMTRFIATLLLTLLFLLLFSFSDRRHPLALWVLLLSVSVSAVLSPLFECLRCLSHTEDNALRHIVVSGYDFTPYLSEISCSLLGTAAGLLLGAYLSRLIRRHFG